MIALGALSCSSGSAPHVYLSEDITGHLLVNRNIEISESGVIRQETYDFLCGGTPHEVRKLGRLTPEQSAAIRQLFVREKIDTIPHIVPKSDTIFPDSGFRSIEADWDGHHAKIKWEPLGVKSDDPDVKRFNAVWSALHEILALKPFEMPPSRPCKPGE